MRVENKNSNRVNFTSVVSARVIIDGQTSVRTSNVRRAIRGLQSILINPANKNDKFVKVKKEFSSKVKDLNYYGEKVQIGEVIRNIVDPKKGLGYLFTGVHAENLNTLGKAIGPEKHKALEVLGTTKSYESSAAIKAYFEKANEFITHAKSRVSEKINPRTMSYEGDELVLNIYAKSIGKPGKKGYKLEISSVEFKKAQTPPSVSVGAKAATKPKTDKPKAQMKEEKPQAEPQKQEGTTSPKRFNDRYKPKACKKHHGVQKELF